MEAGKDEEVGFQPGVDVALDPEDMDNEQKLKRKFEDAIAVTTTLLCLIILNFFFFLGYSRLTNTQKKEGIKIWPKQGQGIRR